MFHSTNRGRQACCASKLQLDRNGHVLAHSIARSSGYADLDNEVMAMIMRAEPLPPFPACGGWRASFRLAALRLHRNDSILLGVVLKSINNDELVLGTFRSSETS
jgi:TonB family protein